ncbi:hypothetical protein DSECCO2_588690 [anaerobic digester metagenome]
MAIRSPRLLWPITNFSVPFEVSTVTRWLPQAVSQSWVSGIVTFGRTVPSATNGVSQRILPVAMSIAIREFAYLVGSGRGEEVKSGAGLPQGM